jgi:hypothetical protein
VDGNRDVDAFDDGPWAWWRARELDNGSASAYSLGRVRWRPIDVEPLLAGAVAMTVMAIGVAAGGRRCEKGKAGVSGCRDSQT